MTRCLLCDGAVAITSRPGCLGMSEASLTADLVAALQPSRRTFDDYLAGCPRVSISEVMTREAARLGKPAADLTEEEFRPAYHRAVIAALHGTEQA